MRRFLYLWLWLWCGTAVAAPALWLAQKGEQQFWLFGSVHIADERLKTLPLPVTQALSNSELLLLEVDPLKINASSFAHVLTPGTDWQHRLGTPLADELEQAVTTSGHAMLQQLPPWFAALQLTQLKAQELGFHSRQGVDMQLRLLARQQSVPVAGLEQPTLVMELLASLHERGLERDFVSHSLLEMTQLQSHLDRLLTTWLDGDEQALLALLQEEQSPALTRFIEHELLEKRNRLWLQRLEQLNPQQAFIVVGALHLYGEQGLINLLENAGYALSKVKDKSVY